MWTAAHQTAAHRTTARRGGGCRRPGLPARGKLLAATLAALALLAGPAAPAVAQAGWQQFPVPATGSYALRYLPPGLDPGEPAPAVVFLHGAGATPEDWRPFLTPVADELGCVLVLPAALSGLGFGVGADDRTVVESLRRVAQEVTLDPARVAVSGHSAGGAYAFVLAHGGLFRFSGLFTLAAPYRTVLAVADPDYTAPWRMYYGTEDPNYQFGGFTALAQQATRLGIPWQADLQPGHGHSTWPEGTLRAGFAFLLEQRYGTPGGCLPGETRLCLAGGRFAVEATWRDFQQRTGAARVTPARTPEAGLLWFFQADRWELQVKLVDGCGVNGHYWLFAAGTTNVAFTLRVTDLAAGREKVYENPLGSTAQPILDTRAFATCP